jgi:hypothetical protein|eukprot:COSAG01_NODE_6382_length_3703_cov_2.503607_4_plen_72_part_00
MGKTNKQTGFINVPLKKASKRKTVGVLSRKQLAKKKKKAERAENWNEKKLVHVIKRSKKAAVAKEIKKNWA